MRVVVRDGVALAAVGQRSGIPRPAAALTVDQIYDEVLEWVQETESLAEFEIRFDEERHFIESVELDQAESAGDDEYTLRTSCFDLAEDGCPLQTLTVERCAARGGVVVPLDESDPASTCEEGSIGHGQVEPGKSVCCMGQ